jgi:predicted RNase H-like nuclease (RuvC/YqgF family)
MTIDKILKDSYREKTDNSWRRQNELKGKILKDSKEFQELLKQIKAQEHTLSSLRRLKDRLENQLVPSEDEIREAIAKEYQQVRLNVALTKDPKVIEKLVRNWLVKKFFVPKKRK